MRQCTVPVDGCTVKLIHTPAPRRGHGTPVTTVTTQLFDKPERLFPHVACSSDHFAIVQ